MESSQQESVIESGHLLVEARMATHGDPKEFVDSVAHTWSSVLGVELNGQDVAVMMSLLHLVRFTLAPVTDIGHLEHAAGYLDIARSFSSYDSSADHTRT